MNALKPWLATAAGVAVAIVLAIIFFALGSGTDGVDGTEVEGVKGWLWILPVLAIVAGLAIDLVVRQKKVNL